MAAICPVIGAIFAILTLVIGSNADVEGCNGEDHGISCCYKGFSFGDNDNGGNEKFIHADNYNIGCFESCKNLHPESTGITVSLKETYESGGGAGRNKCWCELGKAKLDPANHNYKTCVFTIPGAMALTKDDSALSECALAGGSFFGHEGGMVKALPKINVDEDIDIRMSIRPSSLTGVLVAVRGAREYLGFKDIRDYCILELVAGAVVFRLENDKGIIGSTFISNSALNLDDGNFHEIHALKAGNVLTIQVDNFSSQPAVGTAGIKSTDTNNPLSIGGYAEPDLITGYQGSFEGCIKDVFINNKLKITKDMVYGDVSM